MKIVAIDYEYREKLSENYLSVEHAAVVHVVFDEGDQPETLADALIRIHPERERLVADISTNAKFDIGRVLSEKNAHH